MYIQHMTTLHFLKENPTPTPLQVREFESTHTINKSLLSQQDISSKGHWTS